MIDIKKAATPEGNGNHRHEDTNFFRWKEPHHQFTGTGPYKGFEFTRISLWRGKVLPRLQTDGKPAFRYHQLLGPEVLRIVGMVLSITG